MIIIEYIQLVVARDVAPPGHWLLVILGNLSISFKLMMSSNYFPDWDCTNTTSPLSNSIIFFSLFLYSITIRCLQKQTSGSSNDCIMNYKAINKRINNNNKEDADLFPEYGDIA